MNTPRISSLSLTLILLLPPVLLAEQANSPESATTEEPKRSDLLSFKLGNTFSGRLGGELLLGPATASGGAPPGRGENETIMGYLAQFQLSGSFTGGRDLLRLGFGVGDFDGSGFAEPNSLNTNMALVSYQYDQLDLTTLEYRFAAFNDRVVFTIQPIGFGLSSVLTPNSNYVSVSQGALSRFASFTPIYRIGSLNRGVGIDVWLSKRSRLQFATGYRDSDHYAFGLQYLFKPTDDIVTGVGYVYSYAEDGTLSTFTGSNNADTSGGFDEPADIHALNFTLQWRFHPKLTFGALTFGTPTFGTWLGAAFTDSRDSDAKALSTTFMFSLGLSDPFGREGDLAAIMIGQPFRLDAGVDIVSEDKGFGMQYEAFYRYKVNENLSITPGFFYITEPGHISNNNDIFIAAVRAAFRF